MTEIYFYVILFFIATPHGQPHAVFEGFISISGG